jgi:hypothetical protein
LVCLCACSRRPTAQHSTARPIGLQQAANSTAQHSTTDRSAAGGQQHSTARPIGLQQAANSTAQHSTAQHSTTDRSAAGGQQHSTAQHDQAPVSGFKIKPQFWNLVGEILLLLISLTADTVCAVGCAAHCLEIASAWYRTPVPSVLFNNRSQYSGLDGSASIKTRHTIHSGGTLKNTDTREL